LYGNAAEILFVSDALEFMFIPSLVVEYHFVKSLLLGEAGQYDSPPEIFHRGGNFIHMRFERKVTSIDELDLCIGNVAPEGLGAPAGKKNGSFLPQTASKVDVVRGRKPPR